MHITTRCPKCGVSLKVPGEMAGRQGRCPKCRATLRVPSGLGVSGEGRGESAVSGVDAAQTAVMRATAVGKSAVGQGGGAPEVEDEAARCRRLVDAFVAEVEPVKRSRAYKLAIPLVASIMVLLPLVYMGLIIATAYLIYYHAGHGPEILQPGHGRGGSIVLGIYLTPIVGGVILIFFMVKPLFARPERQVRTRSLTPQGEPMLFAVVERLCALLGTPQPTRIDVDYQFNASAHFRRGIWSMWGNDLVLTIGVPLAAGLTLRQLVGVLAHELGHFSQGAGMRFSYVVYSINGWFARLVYERDAWDAWLDHTAGDLDIRIGWILHVSRLFIWLSRRILWVLMVLGHIVSGFLMRQMEFDADRYQARVVGAETFASTYRQIQLFGMTYQFAMQWLSDQIQMGSYPDNLPKLMQFFHERMPPEAKQEIATAMEAKRTGIFDTHPCDMDRIASVQSETGAGAFRADGPARALFCHFDATTLNVTMDMYREWIGPKMKATDVKPVEQYFEDLSGNSGTT